MDSLFEFLFKYRPLIFDQGEFAFRASWVGYLAVAAARRGWNPHPSNLPRGSGKQSAH